MINYTVYDASGNSFVIFYTKEKKDYKKIAIELCRKEDVDGLIVVIPHKIYDFEWLFYNNDGSIASMCGNGTRAVAHYAYNNNITKSSMRFLTQAGVIKCTVKDDLIQTTMTKPKLLKDEFEEFGMVWWQVDTGVPHLVSIVDDLNSFDIELCAKMRYKYNSNVNFAQIKNNKLYVRTYERGVEGETLACGTGMVASFLRANNLHLIGEKIKVYPKSAEELTISYKNNILLFEGKVIKKDTRSYDKI
jgi:diaminopimelate epimerase